MSEGRRENHPQPVATNHPALALVADDLTGACDTAVAFASVYPTIRVQIFGDTKESADIHVITTESRNLPAPEAEFRLREVIEQLPGSSELFKKIDSIFRGNTVAEIIATLRYAHFDLAILAPAYPALGRTVRKGVLCIDGAAGIPPISIGDLLTQTERSIALVPAGQAPDTLAATLHRHIGEGTSAVLCDASTQFDMVQIVRAARSLNKRILWIGSGSLAHALADDLPALAAKPHVQPRTGATIFFIGSPHPASRTQVHNLRQTARISEPASQTLQHSPIDLLVPVSLDETTPDDIRRALTPYSPAQIGCLFMTGGDTAHFVCRALNIQALRLLDEFAPGVPVAVAEGGPFDGVRVVLKSGGFGEPDLLCRLLEAHHPKLEVSA